MEKKLTASSRTHAHDIARLRLVAQALLVKLEEIVESENFAIDEDKKVLFALFGKHSIMEIAVILSSLLLKLEPQAEDNAGEDSGYQLPFTQRDVALVERFIRQARDSDHA